uniref:Uncharacterized protein n=1 Tax=Gasterosteus aculeatus TaxID=69293 RepID=G3Q662_GASAC
MGVRQQHWLTTRRFNSFQRETSHLRVRVRVRGRGGRAAVHSGGGVAVRSGLGQRAGGAFWVEAQPDRTGVPVLPVPHRDGELLLLLLP